MFEYELEAMADEWGSEAVCRGAMARCVKGHTFGAENAVCGNRMEMVHTLIIEGVIGAADEVSGKNENELLELLLASAPYALPESCCPACHKKGEAS